MLDLAWLHTLADEISSASFQTPTADFEVLEGPHSPAVLRVTSQQREALVDTFDSLLALGILAPALDVISQVSLAFA